MLSKVSGSLKRSIGMVLAIAVAISAGIIGLAPLARAATEFSVEIPYTQKDSDAENGYFTFAEGKWETGDSQHTWSKTPAADNPAGTWYKVNFTGHKIDIYAGKNKPMGKVEYFIDGTSKGTFDLYNASNINSTLITTFDNLSEGPHVFEAKATGQKRDGATGTNIDAAKVVVYQNEDESAPVTLHGTFVDENLQWTQDKATQVKTTNTSSKTLNAWKNDTVVAEISLLAATRSVEGVTATASELTGADGKKIAASHVGLTFLASTLAYTGMPGWNNAPNSALPVGDRSEANDILDASASTPRDISRGKLQNIWVSVNVPADTTPGSYTGKVTVNAKDLAQPVTLTLTVDVADQTLPAASEFANGFDMELWQNPFASAEYYGVKAFSAEHLNLLKSEMRKYASIGGDAITTTIVDEAWNGQTYSANDVHVPSMVKWTKKADGQWSFNYDDFDAWVKFNKDLGIGHRIVAYSISPWNGQVTYTDAATGQQKTQTINSTKTIGLNATLDQEWTNMWRAFLTDFVKHLEEKGWKDQTYIGIDERGFNKPSFDLVDSVKGTDGQPLKIAGAMDGFTDSGKRALADRVDVLSIGSIAVKAHPTEFAQMVTERKAKNLKTTVYTCTGHKPSSFALSAPGESYWTMMYSASVGADGFLRWAYDSWVKDPLRDTTHINFEAGDSFLIYPSEKDAQDKTIKSSVRLEKLAQGVRDVNKLLVLSKKSDTLKGQVDALLKTVKSTYPAGTYYLTDDGKQAVANDMATIQTCIATLSEGGTCKQQAQAVAGQYAYYSFNELNPASAQVMDEWGSRNSTNNTVQKTTEGIYGNAIEVDPQHKVTFPANTELTDQWTVGYWAKSTQAPTDRASILTSSDGARSFDARIASNNAPVGVHVNNTAGGVLTYRTYTMPNNQWVHFTWTKAPGAGLTLYVNGERKDSNAWTNSNDFDAPIDVFGGVGFTGAIDEVKIYNRALSADEVAQVMAHPGLSVTPGSVSIRVEKTQQLTASAQLEDGSTPAITYAVDKPEVASVSNTGLVTGLSVGAATITVKAGELTKTVPVTVEPSIYNTIPTYDLPEQYLSDVEKKPNTNRQYLGQPDLIKAKQADGSEMLITTYPVGHGHGPLVMQTSTDRGKTWVEKKNIPAGWANSWETPTLYTLDMTNGQQKLILITGRPSWGGANKTGGWDTSISTDGGNTWSAPKTQHETLADGSQNFSTVAMASLIQLKDDKGNLIDKWMGVYHNEAFVNYASYLTFDANGNEVWSDPVPYLEQWRSLESEYQICEVGMFRSPDGKRIVALARTQRHMSPSVMFYSDDEGKTWSKPVELPGSLYGERHKAVYDPETGKLVVFFREMILDYNKNGIIENDDYRAGDWVAWVGTYDQLMNRQAGDYRIRLEEDWSMNAFSGDTGYSGVVTDPDGTITAVSYGHWDKAFSEAAAKAGNYNVRTDLSYIKQAKFKLDYFEKLNEIEQNRPKTTEEWKARNVKLDDYKKLEEKLAGKDPMTWLFTGDSITHGVVHTNGLKRYSEYFEDYLRTYDLLCHDRSKDVVMNTAVSSADTSWLRGDIDSYVKDRNADVVFMAFGMNDGRQDEPLVSLADYKQNLLTTINEIREAGGVPILMTQNYHQEKVATNSNDNLEQYFEAERQLAAQEGVILIDFAKWWTENNDGQRINAALMNDDLHPNQTGHLKWAQFILSQLNMLNKDSRLAQATSASVPKTGETINTNVVGEQKYVGSSGLDLTGFKVAPKKSYQGTSETVTATEGLEAFAAANAGNYTIRFRTSAPASNTESVIATFADKDSDKVLTASIMGGKVRVSRNFGSGYDVFSLKTVVNDGQFHTLSVNLKDDGLKIWVDGTQELAWNNAAAKMGPHNFTINTVTLGGALAGKLANMHKSGESAPTNAVVDIDYLEAFPQVLTDAQAVSVDNGDTESYVDPQIVAMYDIQNNNPRSITWSVLGGATTQGTMAELSAKSWVQTFQEVFSYEHNSGCSIPAGVSPYTGEDYAGCANRMKYVDNAALRGLSSADLLGRYNAVVKDQKSNVVVIAPDVIYQGKVVEKSVADFKANIEALVDAVKADGAKVILMSPAQLGEDVADYAAALAEIAQAQTLTYVDASTWIAAVNQLNDNALPTEWFDASGEMRAKGQLELGKFFMKSIKLTFPNNGRIAALNFSGGPAAQGVAPQFANISQCVAPSDQSSTPANPGASTSGSGAQKAGQTGGTASDTHAGGENLAGAAQSELQNTGANLSLNLAAMMALLLAGGGALAVARRQQKH